MLANQARVRFEHFLLFFIILQPVLDLLTSLSIVLLKSNATVGILVRFLIMAVGGIYILIQAKEKENRKFLIYLILLAVVLGIGFINNKLVKNPIVLGEEVKFVAKALYIYIMLGSYILALKSLKKKVNISDKVRNSIVYSTLIINAIMVISISTSTDFGSYQWMKVGSRGWFYAGNELGSILAIIFPIVVLYSIQKTKSVKHVLYWIPSLLMIYSLIQVGTKVGMGSIGATLAAAIGIIVLQLLFDRRNPNKMSLVLNGLIAIFLLAGVVGTFKMTPLAQNMGIHNNYLSEQNVAQQGQKEKEIKEKIKKEEKQHKVEKPEEKAKVEAEVKKELEKEQKKENQENLIFSGRQVYEERHKQFFKEAPMSQKLFGMGYAGNFKYNEQKEPDPKLIEMDFHDWFYDFGIIGFALMMIPFIYYGVRILLAFVTRFKEIFNVKYGMITASLVLALGIAYIAGHILTAPGVGIYFVVVLACLIVDLEIE
ncbi:O-antigen ligase family protein [Bacillus sp. TH22]|uniref:O-antigen ligase family protein n=1 Tax=unclassified Bacillus (in: firmicutes) TaxID=185979 RepID=UPI001914AF21|nr:MULTISPECIES: O-antigen ligase family protein [unclassified Bacillus (in: firmicutes)]MBK5361517.1 O-antigen ligase family protein [Bacillus sp. TH44]MBK5348224.1 O-antigen ligase family protein [Bacillus sp. TH45]MBK5364877.1 O-antigen ligase family protein [Bacillus sp. TH50]MBK5450031.1 O-antigen ligase family protein [Bacillus sp. TH22]MBK5456222.1 O-antigen ligase family protein [Bacillus sp. TH23]